MTNSQKTNEKEKVDLKGDSCCGGPIETIEYEEQRCC
jgi:hypothetical protein